MRQAKDWLQLLYSAVHFPQCQFLALVPELLANPHLIHAHYTTLEDNKTSDTLRKPNGATKQSAMDWNPQGLRKGRRPRKTWKRIVYDRKLMTVGRPRVKQRD